MDFAAKLESVFPLGVGEMIDELDDGVWAL